MVTANEMHVPVGRRIRLVLYSHDVIHSFWVPPLGGKLDLIPGMTNVTWIQADRPGIYRGQCAEYCGIQQANMALLVVAQPVTDFEAWLTEQRRPARPPVDQEAARGRRLFIDRGCALQALLLRLQLTTADGQVLDPVTYNRLFTMHGTTMMFLFVIPFIEALANYLLPLMLGTRDLPFPRLTALSYWTYLFDGGWFAYVPLTGPRYSPGLGLDLWDIGLSVAEVAAMGAAAELIVGVLRMRAPGMSLDRLPLFAWAMLAAAAVMIIFAFTPLIVGTAMLELDRNGLTRFFDPDAGGKPLLWQHCSGCSAIPRSTSCSFRRWASYRTWCRSSPAGRSWGTG